MTRPDRPVLAPGLRLLDRGAGEVQVGTHHPTALVLAGLSPADREVVHHLDGRTRGQLASSYTRRGEDPARLDELLALLRAHHLLDGHRGLRALPGDRDDARALPVLVAGTGDLADEIARALSRQHDRVRVQPLLGPDDLPAPPTTAPSPAHHAVAVLVADGAVDPVVARQWAPWATVLPVAVADRTVTIGPTWADLADPCPMCLDHYRADRDPAWPLVLAQLTAPGADGLPRPARAGAAVTAVTCGIVADLVLRVAEGRRPTPGLALELDPGELVPRRRVWPLHPRCVTHLPAEEALAG